MAILVYSVDMWGHVPADCSASYGCDCINPLDEDMHNDDACDCCEDMNDCHRVGSLDIPDGAVDDAIVAALIEEGFLKPEAKEQVTLENCEGRRRVEDAQGRCILMVESEEE